MADHIPMAIVAGLSDEVGQHSCPCGFALPIGAHELGLTHWVHLL